MKKEWLTHSYSDGDRDFGLSHEYGEPPPVFGTHPMAEGQGWRPTPGELGSGVPSRAEYPGHSSNGFRRFGVIHSYSYGPITALGMGDPGLDTSDSMVDQESRVHMLGPQSIDMHGIFKSEAQRRYLWMKDPKLAQEFADKTPSGAELPYHVKKSK